MSSSPEIRLCALVSQPTKGSRDPCLLHLPSKSLAQGTMGPHIPWGPDPCLRVKRAESRWDGTLSLHQFQCHDWSKHRHFLPGPLCPSCLATLFKLLTHFLSKLLWQFHACSLPRVCLWACVCMCTCAHTCAHMCLCFLLISFQWLRYWRKWYSHRSTIIS